jgi:hypothetical protein
MIAGWRKGHNQKQIDLPNKKFLIAGLDLRGEA